MGGTEWTHGSVLLQNPVPFCSITLVGSSGLLPPTLTKYSKVQLIKAHLRYVSFGQLAEGRPLRVVGEHARVDVVAGREVALLPQVRNFDQIFALAGRLD